MENTALLLTTFIRSALLSPISRACFQATRKKTAACTNTTKIAKPQKIAMAGLLATWE